MYLQVFNFPVGAWAEHDNYFSKLLAIMQNFNDSGPLRIDTLQEDYLKLQTAAP